MIDRRPFLKNFNPGLNIIAEIIWKLIPKNSGFSNYLLFS